MRERKSYSRWGWKRAGAAVAVLLVLAAAGACTTTRVQQYQDFGVASQAYTRAMIDLLEETKVLMKNANSERLRPRSAAPNDRRQTLNEQDRDTGKLIAVLKKIQIQTARLGIYFQLLAELARSEAPAPIAEKLKYTVNRLQEVSSAVGQAELTSGKPIKDYPLQSRKWTLANIQVFALEREMQQSGRAVAGLLDLQVKAAMAVGELLETTGNDLKDGEWLLSLAIGAGKKVCLAADQLRGAFYDLAEDCLNQDRLNELNRDIADLKHLADQIRRVNQSSR